MQKHSLIICCVAAVAAVLAPTPAFAQAKKKPAKPAADASAATKPAAENGAAHYDAILKKYVDPKTGHIAYGALKANKADMASFKKFMDWQATADDRRGRALGLHRGATACGGADARAFA